MGWQRVGHDWETELKVKVVQSCPTVFYPMDIVHVNLQARILEWVAFLFSRGSSQTRDWTQVSCTVRGFFTSWATREVQNWTELKVKCIRIQINTHICVPAHICEPTVVEGSLVFRKYISNVKGGKGLNLVNWNKKKIQGHISSAVYLIKILLIFF